MAKIIVVDGKRYSFPDEATEADISSALQKTLAPPTPRAPFDGLSKPAAPPPQMLDRNPDGEGAAPRVPNPGVPTRDPTLLGERANAVTRGALPATVAAAAGAPFGGPLGAAAGVTILGATDLTAAGVNALLDMGGIDYRMMGGSDAILAGSDALGVTHPVAPDGLNNMLYAGSNLGSNAIGIGNLATMAGRGLSKVPGVIGDIGNFFAKPIAAQSMVASGAAGGVAQQVAADAGAPPIVQTGAGLIGSVIGGGLGAPKTGAPKAPSAAKLKAKVGAHYDTAHAQDIRWRADDLSEISNYAMADAIDPAHPAGAMPMHIPPSIRAVFREMTDDAAALEAKGTQMDSRTLDLWRRKLNTEISALDNTGQKTGWRIRDAFDEMTNDLDHTITGAGNDVALARDALTAATRAGGTKAAATAKLSLDEARYNDAVAAVRANPTDKALMAAARKARDTLEVTKKAAAEPDPDIARLEAELATRRDVMEARDPLMAKVVAARKAAITKFDQARADQDEVDELYNTAKDALAASEDALQKANTRLSATETAVESREATRAAAEGRAPRPIATLNDPNLNSARTQVAKRGAALADETKEAKRLEREWGQAKVAASAAKNGRDLAVGAAREREMQLAPAADGAKRMDTRVTELANAQEAYPDYARTRAIEGIPAAAAESPTGRSGDQSRAMRQQVTRFITDYKTDFAKLPPVTQRALERFANGGGMARRTLDTLGRLSPGAGDGRAAGNIAALVAGLGGLMTGGAGGAALPIATVAGGFAARSMGNAMGRGELNKVRDLVALGQAAKPKAPSSTGNHMANFGLNDARDGQK